VALASGAAGEQRGGLQLNPVGNFDSPTYVHGPKGAKGFLFVVERKGTIKVLKNGEPRGTFLDIKGLVRCCDGERGLFSMAFANWKDSRRFYVYFTDRSGDLNITEFRTKRNDPTRADKSTKRKLLDIDHSRYANHNGGQLQWGPDDLLYIATGDGGGAGDPLENAQDKGSLLGKLLRINPLRNPKGKLRYGIPRDNPYIGEAGRNEIYSRGLRNPYRFSFDRNRIAIGDVGQDRFEEVNFLSLGSAKNANFGWDHYEGNARYEGGPLENHKKPVHTYSHSGGGCSITGGYVVRDKDLGAAIRGRYIFGDLCTGKIRSIRADPGGVGGSNGTGLSADGLVSFGTDARDHVYVVAGGTVYRITR
jgi:glucose/arabinose dehydrogenase